MRKLLIFLLVLAALVVAADFGGRALAQSKAGEAIARKAGTSAAPDVSIHGFSFLAQALPGTYQHISVASTGLDVGPVKGISSEVELYDVKLPLGDAVKGDISRLTAGRAELRATVPAAAIGAALGIPGLTITPGDGGSVTVSAPVTVAGRSTVLEATVSAGISGKMLRLTGGRPAGAAGDVPGIDVLLGKLSLELPLAKLPIPITAASISAVPGALVITAQTADVTAAGLR